MARCSSCGQGKLSLDEASGYTEVVCPGYFDDTQGRYCRCGARFAIGDVARLSWSTDGKSAAEAKAAKEKRAAEEAQIRAEEKRRREAMEAEQKAAKEAAAAARAQQRGERHANHHRERSRLRR